MNLHRLTPICAPSRSHATFLLFLLCLGLIAHAQQAPVVHGWVADSATRAPLSGATVSFTPIGRAGQPGSVVTDGSGGFQWKVPDTGRYRIEISYAGYQPGSRLLQLGRDTVTLPTVYLSARAGTMKEVTVRTQKKLVEQTDDRIIYHVENDPLARAQSATDILRRVPFVSVDGDDNVRVNGQTNFKVLLNGRETAMFAQNVREALSGFPGASIVKIEVITAPSARWDAEGVGGIINIVTKKKLEGYNGSVSTWNTTINQHIVNGNFSAKAGKIGVAVNYGIRSNIRIPSWSTVDTRPTSQAFYTRRLLEGDRHFSSFWNAGNAEISWAIDSLITLSFYGNMSGGNSRQLLDQTTTTTFPNSDPLVSRFDQSYRRRYPTNTVGTDYIRRYAGKPEREFSFRINAELGTNNSFLQSEETASVFYREVRNNALATNRQYTLQTDYMLPLKAAARLEIGARATLRRAASDFESLVRYNGDAFQRNGANTDNFRFVQDVYAGYGSYSFKRKAFSFRGGVRLEHTRINGRFASAKAFARNSYLHLLPNLQISTRVKQLGLVLSYTQRLQRPFITHLNPFVSNNDSLNISYGNPNLEAQTIHTVSLQSTLQKGKTFMGLTFSGSYSNNMIVTLLRFDPATGVRSSTFENVGRDFLFNVNGNINAPLSEKWTLNSIVNFQYRTLRNKSMREQRNSGIAGNTSLGATYALHQRWMINNYIGFEQAIIDLQSKPNTIPFCGSGINYQVVPNKLRIGLMAQNYFARHYDYITYMTGPGFDAVNRNHNLMGKMVFTANWNFGKLKEKVSKKKGVTNDDTLVIQ